ncbi:acyl-CoA dehydrogenase family protein [Achromobacter denitrificans]|uniref:acyl-CoA dehydrogenase family protein n=1 Tax=Achromobacter denitrificans TaxID=32002 RepID=UPI0023E8147C|nr:acyl-CoA dehydrogenase family protein [Achromobacter denitrificans]MDF3848395.1 acyl-CoA dehydrogenase family protein [Achromobacter denitrificans]
MSEGGLHIEQRSTPQLFAGLSDDEMEVLAQADRFARAELYPLAQRMDEEEWWPAGIFERIGANGYFGITAPEALGGTGLNLFTSGLVLQAFARWNHALALAWVAHENLCLHNILRNASDEQKARFVPGLSSGKLVGALGLTEPGAGSDALGSMRTTARRVGDHYVLDGTKIFITNGPVADVLLVYAKTDRDLGAQGISAFLVEKGMPGFRVAQKLVKMGFRGSQTGELVFDGCRVPVANLMGRENAGVKVVMSGLDFERAMIAPLCLGIAERALELSIDYARARQQFGKPIASFQMVQDKIATMYTQVEAMRVFTYQTLRAASALENGDAGRGEIHKLTAAAVMFAANGMHGVLDEAVQVHGGTGYIWESEINRLYRAIKLLEIGAGTTEVRKLIISGELLKG